jgi:hypothetical protein
MDKKKVIRYSLFALGGLILLKAIKKAHNRNIPIYTEEEYNNLNK